MSKTKQPKEQKPESIPYKQSRLNGLMAVIELNQRVLSPREKEHEEALKHEMGVRLNTVLSDAKHKELDVKLDVFQKLIDMLKHGVPEAAV